METPTIVDVFGEQLTDLSFHRVIWRFQLSSDFLSTSLAEHMKKLFLGGFSWFAIEVNHSLHFRLGLELYLCGNLVSEAM